MIRIDNVIGGFMENKDLFNEMMKYKNKIIKDIESAAKYENIKLIISSSEKIKYIENLIQRYEELKTDFNNLSEDIDNYEFKNIVNKKLTTDKFIKPLNNLSDNLLSKKELGEQKRELFIHKLHEKGIYLNNIKGSLYENKNGEIIGIASSSYSNYQKYKRWWLGLPMKDYHAFILLCEQEDENLLPFIFPKEFYNKYKFYISRDKSQKQLKFPIFFKLGKYTLKIPNIENGNILIDKYINNFKCL